MNRKEDAVESVKSYVVSAIVAIVVSTASVFSLVALARRSAPKEHAACPCSESLADASQASETCLAGIYHATEFDGCGVVLRSRDSVVWVPGVKLDREKKTLLPIGRRGAGEVGQERE